MEMAKPLNYEPPNDEADKDRIAHAIMFAVVGCVPLLLGLMWLWSFGVIGTRPHLKIQGLLAGCAATGVGLICIAGAIRKWRRRR
jgi:hypothetical protein